MKLLVKPIDRVYYIILTTDEEDYFFDANVAEKLGLTKKDYHKILLNRNAFRDGLDCYFRTEQEAENAIKTLDPYLIMATLIN